MRDATAGDPLGQRRVEAQPQAVADAVLRLIETPAGQRPLRTVVEAHPEAVEAINGVCAQVQGGMLGALGMSGLLKVTTRGAS